MYPEQFHQLLKVRSCKQHHNKNSAGDISSPRSDLEPLLERQPAEGVDDEFPLPEVCSLVYAGQVAGEAADWTGDGRGLHPALVLPVRGLQTARTPAAWLDFLPALPVLVAGLVAAPAVADLGYAPLPGDAPNTS